MNSLKVLFGAVAGLVGVPVILLQLLLFALTNDAMIKPMTGAGLIAIGILFITLLWNGLGSREAPPLYYVAVGITLLGGFLLVSAALEIPAHVNDGNFHDQLIGAGGYVYYLLEFAGAVLACWATWAMKPEPRPRSSRPLPDRQE